MGRKYRHACAGAAILLVATLVPLTNAGAVASSGVDRDGNKIFDSLDRALERGSAGERLDVVALFSGGDSHAHAAAARAAVGPFETTYEYETIPAVAASMTPGQIRALAARGDVVHVQPDSELEFALAGATSSTGADHAVTDFGVDGNNQQSVQCPGVRQYCKDDVVVAVIDSGIDTGHADLDAGKVLGGSDCSYGTCSGSLWGIDTAGHGTHVASIIAGEGDGNPANRGLAPGAALVSLKVGSSGSTVTALDAALEWVLANRSVYGIDLVNMSLTGKSISDGTDTTSRLANRLAAAGVTPFAAAGNGAPDPGTVSFPAAAKYATAVGNMSEPGDDPAGDVGGYALNLGSNRGPTADGRVKPDVVAYGVDIEAAASNTGTGYKSSGGTSAATPFATGVAALMLDANPALASSGAACVAGDVTTECLDGVVDSTMAVPLKDAMMTTAVDWAAPGPDNDSGAGRVDPYAAVDAASPLVGLAPPAQPAHTFVEGTVSSGSYVDHQIQVTGTQWPVAATVIAVDRAAGQTSPDLNLSILDPSGAQVALGQTPSNLRQETAGVRPTVTGTYVVRVTAAAGAGRYWLDVSYPGAVGPPPTPPPPPVAAPDAPAGLTATPVAGSGTQVDLSWGNVADEAGYRVERSLDGVAWAQVGTTLANVTTYQDSGLAMTTMYHYRVRAFNVVGDSPYSNTATATTNGDTAAPTVPGNVKAVAGKGSVALSWTASTDSGGSGLAGYKVFRSTSSTGTFTQVATRTTLTYTDTAVSRGVTYYYYVVAYDNAGNNSSASAKVSGKPT